MATDLVPPFLRSEPPTPTGTLTEHFVVFEYSRTGEAWWRWEPCHLAGPGIDQSRVRWSKVGGDVVPKGEEPDVSSAREQFPDRHPSQIPPSKVWKRSQYPVLAVDVAAVEP